MGLPILWWGRIGKLAQFAGGLVAIIDIVGLQRLTAWAAWLRARPFAPRRQSFLSAGRVGPIYGEVFGSLMDDFQRWANSRPGSPGYRQRVPRRHLSEKAERVRTFVTVAFLLAAAVGVGVAVWYDTVTTESQQTWPWWAALGIVAVVAGFTFDLLSRLIGVGSRWSAGTRGLTDRVRRMAAVVSSDLARGVAVFSSQRCWSTLLVGVDG